MAEATRIKLPELFNVANGCEAYFDELFRFAESRPVAEFESLQSSIDQIHRIAENSGTCAKLYTDFAPHSFTWRAGSLFGGCIFHGVHDGGGDGGAPTFSVSLTATQGWRLHT